MAGARRKLTRGEAGAVLEVLSALDEVSHHDRRVRATADRFSSLYHDDSNSLGVNWRPGDEDPPWSGRNLRLIAAGDLVMPHWFDGRPDAPWNQEEQKGRRGRPSTKVRARRERPWREAYTLVLESAESATRLLAELARRRHPIRLREVVKERWRFQTLIELTIKGVSGPLVDGVESPTPRPLTWRPPKWGPADKRRLRRDAEALQTRLSSLDPLPLEDALVNLHLAAMEHALVRAEIPERDAETIRKRVRETARAIVRATLAGS